MGCRLVVLWISKKVLAFDKLFSSPYSGPSIPSSVLAACGFVRILLIVCEGDRKLVSVSPQKAIVRHDQLGDWV